MTSQLVAGVVSCATYYRLNCCEMSAKDIVSMTFIGSLASSVFQTGPMASEASCKIAAVG